ncbi:MAG: adenylosuccinate synthase [Sphaerochaetaceae bacterium]|nr:adenylosuccinate synthase [Sphaerochaetaceae bacterium]
MSVISIVGAQWGDEGKGRIVDYLAQDADVVIRYQGGDNAGHTVVNDLGKFALHIIPSGIFNPEATSIVGVGAVVNFDTMEQELTAIPKEFHKNLLIDVRAHLIMPYHCLLDGAEEASRSANFKVGTTKRGIGPCYSDKAARSGIRAGELLDLETLRARLEMSLPKKNRDLEYYGLKTFTVDEIIEKCKQWADKFGSQIVDTLPIVRKAVDAKRKIVLEGQLGVMRDLDWGIYPYTTSSNPTSGGAANVSGISPKGITEIIGVTKAYSTSVGGGPFTAELFDEDGKKLRDIGAEYGATTGRPRRCGWLDAVALDYSSYLNGFTSIAVTKLDVLDSFETIKVCEAYELDGQVTKYLPDTKGQERAKPIFKEFKGWMSDTSKARKWEDLPKAAQDYVKAIEKYAGVPVKYVSVGPERDQIIIL